MIYYTCDHPLLQRDREHPAGLGDPARGEYKPWEKKQEERKQRGKSRRRPRRQPRDEGLDD